MIGVTGYAQHGKDSVGKFLVEEYGYTRYAFADQLKSMAFTLNPIVQTYSFPKHPERLQTLVGLMGWDKAKEIAEVRRFLQVLGTEAVRDHLGEDAWVDALDLKLKVDGFMAKDERGMYYPYVWPGAKVVITDVRFPNEAAWVRKLGGKLWRVKRVVKDPDPKYDNLYVPYDNGLGKDHPSERFVGDLEVDRTLTASNLDELGDEVERALGAGMGG